MELKDTPIISDAAGLFLVLMIIGAYIWVAHLEWDLPALETFFVFSLGALVGGILVRWVIDEENKKQKQDLDAALDIMEQQKKITDQAKKVQKDDKEILEWLVNEAKKMKEE